jgi:glycosyltransferase involved in cell wall biosynthesis
MVRVLVVEPFYGGSHRVFLDGLVRHSRHEFELLTLPGGEWRRRMRRGAQELTPAAKALPGTFDLVIVTDMLDLPAFLALTRPRFATTPVLCYFHENQFTYPRLRGTKFNSWFGQINYLSACAADVVAFNSAFHRDDFLGALRTLAGMPNGWLMDELIDEIEAKSGVLPVGVELSWLDEHRSERPAGSPPLILWNHRWEFDKAPATFARAIERLAMDGLGFRLALAGDPGPNPGPELAELAKRWPERVEHSGFAESAADYARLLWESDIVVSTTRHEFFGVGMVEALYCECIPIAPRRYNYPALVPAAWHERCLFEDEEGLIQQLAALIKGEVLSDGAGRISAKRFAWEAVTAEWDDAVHAISERANPPGGMQGSACVRR